MADGLNSLRHTALLSGLSDPVLNSLASASTRRSYLAGEHVVFEGDYAQAGYIVELGQIRVYRTSPAGREQVLAILGAGEAFNLAPVFRRDGTNPASVQALTEVTLVILRCEELIAAVRRSPELALALLRHLADRLDNLANLVADLSLRSVRGRLAGFLLRGAEGAAVPRRWTQDEIASQLGTVRDVIGRALRSFEDDGMVRIDRHMIVLIDRVGLEIAAET